jgi:glycosyltransferase involved in cell wall biosynthesis
VHTAGLGLDDGYNLAVLEAMCSGMPVLSTVASDSPVTNHENGFISRDPAVLRQAALLLLGNPGMAKRLGDRARETVIRDFPVQGFVRSWHQVIERARRAHQARRAA